MSGGKRDTQKREPRQCRMCFTALLTHAEHTIGVHIGCVQESKSKKVIPSPGYGSKHTTQSNS